MEASIMTAAMAHHDGSAEAQTRLLDTFQAIDACYFTTHDSALFSADTKLQAGYPAMYALTPQRFWKSGASKLSAYRDTLWAATVSTKELHARP